MEKRRKNDTPLSGKRRKKNGIVKKSFASEEEEAISFVQSDGTFRNNEDDSISSFERRKNRF